MNKKIVLQAGIALGWLVVFGLTFLYFVNLDISLKEYHALVRDFIKDQGVLSPLVYIFFHAIRPFIFFSEAVLSILGGVLFDPWPALIYAVIGTNVGANIAFIVGRYLGHDVISKFATNKILSVVTACRFKDNGFITVFAMRLFFLPFDLVSFVSGACNVRHRDFAWATFWGTLPSLAAVIFLGGSITDPRNLFLASIFLVFAFLLARRFQHHLNNSNDH